MLVILLEMGNLPSFGWMCGSVVCRLEPGLADYLTCWCVRMSPCLTCVSLGGRVEGEAWRWRQRLFAWEGELVEELRLLLQNVTLQVDKRDR